MRHVLGLTFTLTLFGCSGGGMANETAVAPTTNSLTIVDETPVGPREVLLTAADGTKVYGRYTPVPHARALILLFHQAGSSKDEYATIAPRLAEAGYASLAIDQRAGGTLYGPNQTVAALGREGDYASAMQDLEAALQWAANEGPPVIVWGSSYSSSLVFQLAAKHPGEIAALLSFSPGEYLGDGHPVRDAAAKVDVPVFVTSAQDAEEIAAAKSIFDAVPTEAKKRFVPTKGGVHGSSTLIAARNPGGAEDAWQAVLAFLNQVAPR
ncbi:MAG: alpha/beta hydrolase [Pseudomonadota bacterium]